MTSMFLAASLVISAPQLKPTPADVNPHVGRWTAESLFVDGKVSPQHMGLEYEFTKDGQWIIYRDGKVMDDQPRAYKADQKTKPCAIDVTEYGGTMPAIYKVEGDTLTLSMRTAKGGDRPIGFDAPAEGTMMLVMKRVKQK